MNKQKMISGFQYLWIFLFSFMPLKRTNMVLFSTPDFSDNAWAFYKYLLENKYNETYKIIWLVKSPDQYKKEKNVVFVSNKKSFFMLKRNYYLACSKYIICTHTPPIRKWRKKQIVISTTHSASQLKATASMGIKNQRVVIPDYLLRCGEDGLHKVMEGRNLSREKFVITGMPRLDLLYEHRDCIHELFSNRKIDKVVIAMETFRQHKSWSDGKKEEVFGLNILKSNEELIQLDHELKKMNILLIIKPHPLQVASLVSEKLNNIVFLSDDDLRKQSIQLYQLLENCNGLLTDYSSVFYDFLLLNRPIGFMIGDIESYRRGFCIEDPKSEMCGRIIESYGDLLLYFQDVINETNAYTEMCEDVKKKVFTYTDNHNSERLMKFIESL